ncbi:MAG: hypothetical protein KF681_07490 [Bdellovibrionaceae bacterium]|nr:hypothetical protein [Pseudobdellovibrionaceae bacterium]
MKAKVLFLFLVLGFLQAHAGQSTVLVKSEMVEVQNPLTAFHCTLGDGGYLFTTLSLNAHSIPAEFGDNFKHSPGITTYFTNQSGATPCHEAMKPIQAEIEKQGGKLKVLVTRTLAHFAYPDKDCKLYLAENLELTVGSITLSGVNTYFIQTLPGKSYFECRDLIPDQI